jgi:hypothetical protein
MLASPDWMYVIVTIIGVGLLFGVIELGAARINAHASQDHRQEKKRDEAERHEGPVNIGFGFASLGLLFGLVHFVARRRVVRAAAEEDEWLARLPFPSPSHYELLASGNALLRVELRGDSHPTESEWAERVMVVLSNPLTLTNKGVLEKENTLLLETSAPSEASGFDLHRGVHAMVENLLLPLHAKHPIKRVFKT